MRILILSQHFYPEIFRINQIAKDLVSRGMQVDVITGIPNYPSGKIFKGYKRFFIKKEVWANISIYRLPIFLRGLATSFELVLNYFSFILSGLILAPFILRKNKYNIVFCYATSPFIQVIPAIFLAWIKKSKLIVNVQDLWPHSISATGHIKNKLILNLINYLIDYIYKKCDFLLVQSKSMERLIREKSPTTNILYWPNSVDNFFLENSKTDINIDYHIDHHFTNNFSILFAGNIGRAQSMQTIIDAAEILKSYDKIKIIIAGDGSTRELLVNSIKEKKLSNIYWIGSYPIEFMPTLFSKASVLLVSLSNDQIFEITIPNKIQAYLAAGKPIIACMNGEGAQIIKSARAGFTAPANNSQELASVILRMSQISAVELSIMGSNARDYFYKNFDNDMLINSLIDIFNNQSLNS